MECTAAKQEMQFTVFHDRNVNYIVQDGFKDES